MGTQESGVQIMKPNFFKIAIIIVIIMVLVVFAIVVLPWLMIALGSVFMPKPPEPQIKYGEFPFRLEYEINGEKFVVEDTVICEYDGIGWNEGTGKHRKWKEYLASNGEKGVLLLTDTTRKIYCFVGSARYYMGDENYPEERPLTPRIYDIKLDDNDMSIFTQNELRGKYNIKLVSWEFSEPIENSFKNKEKMLNE
jgi:hypothetical protein